MNRDNNIKSIKQLKKEQLISLRGGVEPTWDGECAIYYNNVYQGLEDMVGLEGSSASQIDASCAAKKGLGYTCFCNYID